MGLLKKIKNTYMGMVEAVKDKREFQNQVEAQAKPIRRQAYLKERLKQAMIEGKMIATKEFETKKEDLGPEKKKDYSLGGDLQLGLQDPFKFINGKGGNN